MLFHLIRLLGEIGVVELRKTGTCLILTQDAIYLYDTVGIIFCLKLIRDLRSQTEVAAGYTTVVLYLYHSLATEGRPFFWCTKLEATSTALRHDDTIKVSTQANRSSNVKEKGKKKHPKFRGQVGGVIDFGELLKVLTTQPSRALVPESLINASNPGEDAGSVAAGKGIKQLRNTKSVGPAGAPSPSKNDKFPSSMYINPSMTSNSCRHSVRQVARRQEGHYLSDSKESVNHIGTSSQPPVITLLRP
jgi:hypothetical protein